MSRFPTTSSGLSYADAQRQAFGIGGGDVQQRSGGNLSVADLARYFGRDGLSSGDVPTRVFEQVGVVNRCVRTIGDSLKQMPLMISTVDDEIIESGDVLDLLDNPFPGLTGEDLVEWTAALPMLTGAAYWIKDDGADIGGASALRPVGAQYCRPYYENGELVSYQYSRPAAGEFQWLEPGQVVPFVRANFQTERLFDPMSAVGPARMAINQVFGADVANLSSLHNGIDPGLAFTLPGRPTDEQIKDMREQLDARHQGPSKRNRPLFLYDGMTISDFVKKFTEMEFAKLKQMSIADVCVAFGVPPLVLGYSGDGALGQGKETEQAHQIFWQITVLPLAHWIAGKITTHVLPQFPQARTFRSYGKHSRQTLLNPAYRAAKQAAQRHRVWRNVGGRAVRQPTQLFAWFDASAIGPVKSYQWAQISQVLTLNDKGVPLNQLICAFDLPIEEQPWGDTWWKPIGLVDVQTEMGTPGSQDGDGSDSEDGADASSENNPESTSENDPQNAPGSPTSDPEMMQVRSLLDNVWHAWRASWAGLEKTFAGRVQRHFMELRAQVLKNLTDTIPAEGTLAVRRDLIGTILFDLTEANGKLLAKVGPLVRESARLGGEQAMREAADALGKSKADPFRLDDPQVVASMRQRNIRITDSNRTLRKRLAQELADGIEAQEPVSKLAERVRKEFNLAATRANTIARTEVGGAVEDARQAGRTQAGTPNKSWLWSRKETGRPWHMACEEQTLRNPIPNEQLFTLPQTNAQTPYPRGPGLTAEDAANCGCTTLARYPGDNIKSVVARYVAKGFLSYEQLAREGSSNGDTR